MVKLQIIKPGMNRNDWSRTGTDGESLFNLKFQKKLRIGGNEHFYVNFI